MRRTGRARARRAAGSVALVLAAALMGAVCGPGIVQSAHQPDQAAEAKRATRELAAVQSQAVNCSHVVMTEEKRTTAAPEYPVHLIDAVATPEPCWDKIVFTFSPTVTDTPPGYEVEYRKPPFTEGDNNQYTVETLGDAFLWLTFTPASSVDTSNPGRPVQTYTGNLRLRLDGMHHTEIVRKIMDGDGTVMWMIGLDEKRPFTVDAANSPPRVIVYVAR